MPYAVRLERSPPLKLSRHVDGATAENLEEWCKTERKAGRRIAVDLFSGAGGLGLGVESEGWSVAVAADHNPHAVATHSANFPGLALNVDMSDPKAVDKLILQLRPLEVDLLVGGPPCQPFSRAGLSKIRSLVASGKWDTTDARRDLWTTYVKVAKAIRPRAILMENVPDMALADDLLIVRMIANELEAADYAVDFQLLDAWRFGVPQHRRRLFLQARRDGGAVTWPRPHAHQVTVRDAIADLPPLGGTTGGRSTGYSAPPTPSSFAVAMRKFASFDTVHDHMTRPVRPDDLEAFELMTSKTLYADLPERLRRYRSDTFNDKYNRLGWDELSRTVTAHIAKDGYWYIHPQEHRTITVREAARLQTFPDRFRFSGSRSDAFRQIGNAVPPLLAQAVATQLLPVKDRTTRAPDMRSLRARLDVLAESASANWWWLFPGHEMTETVAAVTAGLDLRSIDPEAARPLAELAAKASNLGDALDEISRQQLTPGRRRSLESLTRVFDRGSRDSAITALPASKAAYAQLLLGQDQLIITAKSRRNTARLLEFDESSISNLGSAKLAVARLVGIGEGAGARMALLVAHEVQSLTSNDVKLSRTTRLARNTPLAVDRMNPMP